MPIYEYQGQQYDISTDDPKEAKNKILAHLKTSSTQKPTTNILQDVGSGLRDAAENIVLTTPAFLAGGIADLFSSGDDGAGAVRDAMFERYNHLKQAQKNRESAVDRGEVGKVAKAVGQIPAYLTPASAGAMIAGSGLDSGADVIKQGGDTLHGEAALAGDIGMGLLGFGLGSMANVASKTGNALLQGGMNVAQESLGNHPLQNYIRESAGVNKLPEMNPGDYAAAFVPGAAMGAMQAPGRKTATSDTQSGGGELVPKLSDLDSQFVTRTQSKLDSVNKQILFKQAQLDKITADSPNGLSAKQLALYKSLEEQQTVLLHEAAALEDTLGKYAKQEPQQSEADTIKNMSVEDLVGPGKTQRGSWEPFMEMFPERPDESNAPGNARAQPQVDMSTFGRGKSYPNEDTTQYRTYEDATRSLSDVTADDLSRDRARDQTQLVEGTNIYGEKTTEPIGFSERQNQLNLEIDQSTSYTSKEELQRQRKLSGPVVRRWDLQGDQSSTVKKTVSELQGMTDLQTRKAMIGTLIEKLSGSKKTSWVSSISSNRARNGESLKSIIDSAAKESGLSQGRDGDLPLVKYDKNGYIDVLEIPEQYRNTGLGREIVRTIEQEVGKGTFVQAEPASVRFWEKLGYKRTSNVDESGENIMMSKGESSPPKGLTSLIGNFTGKGMGDKQRGAWNPFLSSEEQKVNQAKAVASSIDRIKDLDVTQMKTSDEVLQQMLQTDAKDSGYKIESSLFGFGQFTEAVRKQAPIIWEIAKRIRKTNDVETLLKRTLWSGDASSLPTKGVGPIMSLAHYINPDSLAVVTKQMSVKDKIVVADLLHENSFLGRKHSEADTSKLTPIQQKAYELVTKLYDRIQQETGVRRRNGYIHATREGDFAVGLKTSMGDVTHIQSFKSKEQAAQWANKAKKAGIETTDLIDMTTKDGAALGESFGLIRELAADLEDRLKLPGKIVDELDLMQNWIGEHSTIGKHNVRKVGYTGAEGSKFFVSKEQNAVDFFKSMEDYVGEVATQWKKTLLTREVNDFFNTESGHQLEQKFPEQSATARYLVDVAMNKQGKYQWAEGVDSIRDSIDKLFAKQINKFNKGDSPLYYPDVPVLDRATGIAAQLFYIKALTTRPAFWAGQLLTSPFAIRQVLKEGSVLEAVTAQGKGWGTVMSGGDAQFKKFIQNLKETTDSLHPQFTNEINVLPFMGDKANTTFGKVIDWVSGQKPAAIADTLSRYFTIATAYHFYKDMGMSGESLKANVQKMVDDTMVMYGRGYTSPVLQKMGLVGQSIAPLQKYGLAQLENFVGDIRHMASQPGAYGKIKGSLPAISTLLTTMVMGGTLGTILLSEYEMIRGSLAALFKAMGWDDLHDMLPKSVMETMLTHENVFTQAASGMYQTLGASEQFANDAATHGLPSAATGFDIGSSLRFQPYVPGADGNKEASFLDMVPVIKSIIDTVGDFAVPKVSELVGGQRTEAELRKADLSQQLFVGQRALIDKFKYNSDTRAFVPGGTRGYAQVEQTPKEQLAQVLGTSTLSTAKDRAIVNIEKKHQKKLAEDRQHAVDLIADGILHGKDSKLSRGIELAVKYEMDEKMIEQAVESAIKERYSPRREDLYGSMPKSYEQQRKFMRDLKYE